MKLTAKEHGATITARLGEGRSYRDIAEELGCDKTTVSAFVKLHMPELRRKPDPHKPPRSWPAQPEEPTAYEMLEAQHRALKTAARKHRTVDVQAELLLQEVRAGILPAKRIYDPPERAEGDGHPHAQALLLSDLHAGEVVVPAAVNGLNEFNWEILMERMQRVQTGLYSFQNNRPYPIDELHLWWLGDMMSGNIHEELAETNEFPVAEQCWRVGRMLGEWVEPLVEAYPRIKIVGVAGNHPRVSKPHSSKQVFNSYDWLAYKIAETYLSSYSTVSCEFPQGGYVVDQIAGKNVLLTHGDGIRSGFVGVPWGGVMRRFNELKKGYAEQGVLLDYMAVGHFHQAAVVAGVLMNGSVIGLNEYGLKNFGAGQIPTQLLVTFDKDKERLTDVSFITPN